MQFTRRRLGLFVTSLLTAATRAFAQSDPLELVRRAVALDKANAAREKEFAYREWVRTSDLDSAGKPHSTVSKVHDVLIIEGSSQRVLLEENGTPADATSIANSQGFLRRVIEVRKAESAKERQSRIAAFEKKQREYRDAVAEIPQAFEFAADGEETIQGRSCHRIKVSPRPGYQPHNRYGKIFTQTVGTLWIDKATGQWRRAEGELRDTVNLGWIFVQVQKGTRARVEQKSFGEAGWMMSHLYYRSVVRVGFFVTYRREETADYWNYRVMTPAVLAEALAEGYPKGTLRPQ
jgi:hypothetical protein